MAAPPVVPPENCVRASRFPRLCNYRSIRLKVVTGGGQIRRKDIPISELRADHAELPISAPAYVPCSEGKTVCLNLAKHSQCWSNRRAPIINASSGPRKPDEIFGRHRFCETCVTDLETGRRLVAYTLGGAGSRSRQGKFVGLAGTPYQQIRASSVPSSAAHRQGEDCACGRACRRLGRTLRCEVGEQSEKESVNPASRKQGN